MSSLVRRSHCYTETRQVARKVHGCDWCHGAIEVGETYTIATEFPGGEAGYADFAGHPVRFRLHAHPPCSYASEEADR